MGNRTGWPAWAGVPPWAEGTAGPYMDGDIYYRGTATEAARDPVNLAFDHGPHLGAIYRPKKILDYSQARGDWSEPVVLRQTYSDWTACWEYWCGTQNYARRLACHE